MEGIGLKMSLSMDSSDVEHKLNELSSRLDSLNGSNSSLIAPSTTPSLIAPATTPSLLSGQRSQQSGKTEAEKLATPFDKVIDLLTNQNAILQNSFNKLMQEMNSSSQRDENSKRDSEEKEAQGNSPLAAVKKAIEVVTKVATTLSNYNNQRERIASKAALQSAQALANGDYFEANMSQRDAYAEQLRNKQMLMNAIPLIGGLLGLKYGNQANAIDVGNDYARASRAYEKAYEAILPEITKTSQTFGGDGVNKKSLQTNADEGLAQWSKLIRSYATDTGMNNTDFINLATQLGKYGVNNIDQAGAIAQKSAKWARYTGGDADSFLDFMGIMSRFGSKTPMKDVDYAYGAMKTSGLDKNQFPEFLQGLQRVIEDGISKGYVRSTKDVSETLAMFGKMSGNNPLWTGRYGMQRLQTMDQGLESATALENPAQLLAYQAVNDLRKKYEADNESYNGGDINGTDWYIKKAGSYNTLALMEQGLNAQNFRALWDSIDNAYGGGGADGGDIQQKIEAWKKMGFNTTGAMQILKMGMNKTDDDSLKAKITAMQEDPNLLNDETKLYNVLNKIKDEVVHIGQKNWEMNIDNSTHNYYGGGGSGNVTNTSSNSLRTQQNEISINSAINTSARRVLNEDTEMYVRAMMNYGLADKFNTSGALSFDKLINNYANSGDATRKNIANKLKGFISDPKFNAFMQNVKLDWKKYEDMDKAGKTRDDILPLMFDELKTKFEQFRNQTQSLKSGGLKIGNKGWSYDMTTLSKYFQGVTEENIYGAKAINSFLKGAGSNNLLKDENLWENTYRIQWAEKANDGIISISELKWLQNLVNTLNNKQISALTPEDYDFAESIADSIYNKFKDGGITVYLS